MTTQVEPLSPSTPSKRIDDNGGNTTSNGSSNSGSKTNGDADQEANRAMAAANELSELFQDEASSDNADDQPEIPTNGHVQKIIRENEMRQQQQLQQQHTDTNEPSSNGSNKMTKKFSSPKDSPVDLYGCDDMSPPAEPNSIVNSSSTKPNKQQQSTAQKSNDIGQTLGEKLKPISIASTPSSYENTNLSQSLYNPGFNNENILSQLITNSSNTNGNGNPNYFTMRRERSLDRAPVTENFVENYLINPGTNSLRRSYTNNASQSPQNVAAMFNGQQQQSTTARSLRQQQANQSTHQRSNSNLGTSNSNFNRDYGNGVIPSNGLRSSARALSSTNFSTNSNNNQQNFHRDPSATSLKSLGLAHGSNGNLNSEFTSAAGTPVNGASSKLSFIKDLQIRLMDMQKECYYLRCELDSSQQKLTSSMQSIKQFWSPELKRERQQRKEETGKYNVLLEQYKILQSQYQTMLDNYDQQSIQFQQLQFQLEQSGQQPGQPMDAQTMGSTKQLLKEKSILKKTINELEMRINTQKQSLTTKDDTIKKLFHLVKSANNKLKGTAIYAQGTDTAQQMNDIESLTAQLEASNAINIQISEKLQEEERKSETLRQCLQQLQDNSSMQRSINSLSNDNNYNDNSSGVHSLHVSPKHTAGSPSVNVNNSVNPSSSQFDLLKASEKSLKEKLETCKADLNRKETELQQLKTKMETCESKEKDLQHYLNLLKESISTKDQQITMQQSEINDLRTRIREKEAFIEKKNSQLQAIQLEKHQRDSDIGELRDQMDIKERKINVLNRKIENLEDQLKDKEMQVTTIRSKLSTNTVGAGTMYHANLLKTLEQKDKIIEKLTKDAVRLEEMCLTKDKTAMKQSESESTTDSSMTTARENQLNEQIEILNASIKEMSEKMEAKNKEIEVHQNDIFDLKDELEMLKTQLLRKDSHVNSLELSLTQKNEEIEMIEEKLARMTKKQQQQLALANDEASQQTTSNLLEIESLKKQITQLQKELSGKEVQTKNLTNELVTFKEIIDEFEEQKQLVKSKLERQQAQFVQLEEQYEATTTEFEKKLEEQRTLNEKHVKELEEEKSEALRQQKHMYEQEVKSYEEELEELKKSKVSGSVGHDEPKELSADQGQALREEIEDGKKSLLEREHQISRLTSRIVELEEAMRESVSITAEREIVMSQQKKKSDIIEKDNKVLQEELKSMQKSVYEQQCEFNRYQDELSKREEQLQRLEEDKVEEMNQILVTKQELLLSSISEKDAQIGSLECDNSDSKQNQSRIQQLNEEKDQLHQQLKDLNEKRMKLMQDHMCAKEAKDKVRLLTFNTNYSHDVDGITG